MKIKSDAQTFITKFKNDDVPLLAASLAYYFLLSVFPLLVVAFAIIPYFNISPQDAIQFISSILPEQLASTFQENIVSIVETPRGGLLTIGILGTLWSASNGINAFIKVSNESYEVEETRSFIKTRAIAFGLTIAMIFAVITAIILPVFGDVILTMVMSIVGINESSEWILQISRFAISIAVITLLLLTLYRFAPNAKLPVKHIIPGTLTASILWLIISFGFSIYVSNFGNYSNMYGSLGGVIILMIWFFLTGMILLIGGIINVMYHQKKVAEDSSYSHAANI
ncbi:YihY/virulence factor BrkB family protein [Oceanobacillus iheyensis]|uniref:YihY/virulence factor BrkB family protein n=1 Tax=Oceanobacillus iheyensis TaxID=182710 RepID=UPI0036252EB5